MVMSCANSLPHLLTDEELQLTAENIYFKTKKNGMFIGGIRDYDVLLNNKPSSTPLIIKYKDNQQLISFRVLKRKTNNCYLISQFFIKKKGDEFITTEASTEVRAYRKEEVKKIFESVGFKDVKWLFPEETGYSQPILIAFK
jgi:glycine/sarcosine N-methyltransferase